jgi:hypothetical protein
VSGKNRKKKAEEPASAPEGKGEKAAEDDGKSAGGKGGFF